MRRSLSLRLRLAILVAGTILPLIGFAGSPFTLACYMIEGSGSADFASVRRMAYGRPDLLRRLVDINARAVACYLDAQIEAGVDAVQVFDSWVGALNTRDYREFILPHTKRIFDQLAKHQVPTIHFGVGTGSILHELREAGGDVIGVDWRTPLAVAWGRVGPEAGVQGNLDPTVLLGPLDRIFAATDEVLEQAAGRPGHIFNLGHGISQHTPPDAVSALVDEVHVASRRMRAELRNARQAP